jgi:hypothetical protein
MAKKWRKWDAGNRQQFPQEFAIWQGLLSRQYHPAYQHLDPLWDPEIVGCFECFLQEVGGHRPGPEYSVDRIDNLRGYVKGNLRWATAETQMRNSSHLRWYYQGRPLIEECQRRGIKINSVLTRVGRGWRMEDAVEIPFQGHGRKKPPV